MKKKVISLALFLCCINCAAYAETVADIKNENGRITVSGIAPEDTPVRLTVKSADDDSGYYAIKETVSDGEFFFEVSLRDRETEQDVYEYILTIKGDSVITQPIKVYKNPQSFLDLLTDADEEQIKDLFSVEDNIDVYTNLGINMVAYRSLDLKEQEEICSAFCNDRTADSDFVLLMNDEINLQLLKKSSTQSQFNEGLNKISIVTYDELSDFEKERLFETKDFDNLAGLKSELDLYNAINKINNAKYSQLENLFEENAEILDIKDSSEYSKYTKFSSSVRRGVNEEIVLKLLKNPAKTKEDIKDTFDDAVDNAKSSNSSSGGSSGGTSSGGNRGGSSVNAGGIGSTNSNSSLTVRNEVVLKNTFTDIDDSFWAIDAINKLWEKQIIKGYDDGSFKPDNTITREEFVTVIVNAFNLMDDSAECNFEDADSSKWYYSYIASGYKAGIIKGISETEFGIGKNIIRQDVAVIISSVLKLSGAEIDEKFADDAKISEYANKSVYALKEKNIISGRNGNLFAPRAECTRAECAVMVAKAMGLV